MKQKPSGDQPASGSALYGWEIVQLIPDPLDDKKRMRLGAVIAAPTIEHVWEWLAADRADERTEIESIARFGPIVAVLDARKTQRIDKDQ